MYMYLLMHIYIYIYIRSPDSWTPRVLPDANSQKSSPNYLLYEIEKLLKTSCWGGQGLQREEQ